MAIARVLRRYFGGIVLGLVAALAFFQARGAAQLLGAALLGSGSRTSKLPEPARPPATREVKDGAPVLQRNPFDSATGALQDAHAPTRTTTADFSDPLSWPSCEGVRVSIVTESRDPSWSLTTVQTSGEPRARLRRVGDDVAGKQVAFIGYNPKQLTPAVWLEGSGKFCQSALFRQAEVLPASAPREEGERRIERRRLDSAFENSLTLMRSVRVVPELQAGKVVGLRLFGIRPHTLLSTVGLQNGDRLETINGLSIASPEKALEAYARLRTAPRLRVQLSRAGKPVQLDLNII